MSEMPKFDQMARQLVDVAHVDEWPAFTQDAQREVAIAAVSEELRQVWNARGRADAAGVSGVLVLPSDTRRALDVIKGLDRS